MATDPTAGADPGDSQQDAGDSQQQGPSIVGSVIIDVMDDGSYEVSASQGGDDSGGGGDSGTDADAGSGNPDDSAGGPDSQMPASAGSTPQPVATEGEALHAALKLLRSMSPQSAAPGTPGGDSFDQGFSSGGGSSRTARGFK